jgi:hypothetical protein
MDGIKTHRWEEAFCAIADLDPVPTIRIFFGRNDHWVLNGQRDAFIAKHCSSPPQPSFGGKTLDITADVDPSDDGDESSVVIPHDFSIRKIH